jgi:hypothetical protein
MAEWIYRRENRHGGCIVEPPAAGGDWNHLIAQDVSPEHGPRIALAPRMEEVLRGLSGLAKGFGAVSTCGCYHCSAGRLIAEGTAILREIDAAAGAGEATAS